MSVESGRTSLASETKTLKVGQAAPDFELPEHRGNDTVSLRSFRGEKNIVLVFYPLDWTSV
jgi:peroxiredoxin